MDLGCGSGYWLPGYAAEASEVIGIEPDPGLLPLAQARDRRVRVLAGSAEHIALGDASVDVMHARFAYFWPPRGQAGLTEVLRVLKPGGTLVVVDNDHRAGEFAGLLRAAARSAPEPKAGSEAGHEAGAEAGSGPVHGRADVIDAWWAARGGRRVEVMSRWEFGSRSDFAAVLELEFPGGVAGDWLAEHPGARGLSYGYVLFAVSRGCGGSVRHKWWNGEVAGGQKA